jgi:hypothetical protein
MSPRLRASAAFIAMATTIAVTSAGGSIAHAETFTLRLESDAPRTEYRVSAGEGAPIPWLTCVAPCEIAVTPGRHRIEASGEGFPKGESDEVVVGDTSVKTHVGDSNAKTVGFVVGSVGLAAVGVGLVGAAFSNCFSLDNGCSTARNAQDEKERSAFLVVAGVGAVASLLGWVVYAGSDTSITTKSWHRPRIVSLSVAPTNGGAAFGALGTF